MNSTESRESKILRIIVQSSSRKGYLQKQGGTNKGWKKRWFVLKGNDLFYFETSQENKLMGKFVIEEDCQISEVNDKKKGFCLQIAQKGLKQPRYLAAENDKQRKEWISSLETVVQEVKAGKHKSVLEGFLQKQPPKGVVWKKRWCVLKDNSLYYYRQIKDFLPAGILMLRECIECESANDIKNFCFYLDHPYIRKFYFAAEQQSEANQWIDALRISMGLTDGKISPRKSMIAASREVFLCKVIKEGILNKQKKRDQLKKSKPIRLVLTHNFLYYFPQPSSTAKYHTMSLDDVAVETIPSSVERMPFSFRLVSHIHQFYLSAEDEQEYNTWLNIIGQAQQTAAFQTETKTDKDIKTNKNIDYSLEIVSEKIDKSAKIIGEAKIYEVKVKAFWTSWIVEKKWDDLLQLYIKLFENFPDYIFPEISEEPIYADEALQAQLKLDRRSNSRSSKQIAASIISNSRISKTFDANYDLKSLRSVVKELLRNSEISQSSTMFNFLDLTDVFSAVSRGEIAFVRYFLQQKININTLNFAGTQSPLQLAAEKNNKQIVETLVEYGANPNLPNKKGQTTMHAAAEAGSVELVAYLFEKGGNISAQDEGGVSLLHVAARKGYCDLVSFMLEKGASCNIQDNGLRTPLHYAAIEGELEVAKILVERGADLEMADEEGFTPLMSACWKAREAMVQFLLGCKADVEHLDKYKRTCVHLCVLRKQLEILAHLVNAGASLDIINGSGFAPIHVATSKGYDATVEFLVSKGASVGIRDENTKQTALHIAVAGNKPSIIDLLTKAGRGEVDRQDVDAKTPLHIAATLDNVIPAQLLLKASARLDVHDLNGDTPLHVACAKGNMEMVELFVLNNASLASKQKDGFQPLHLAVQSSNEALVTYLLSNKADANAKDNSGNTPLHLALMKKHHKIAVLLCENGGSLSIMNGEGNPPLYYVKDSKLISQLQDAARR
eukprot:TRINITY_DN6491_c0_g1_i2.p1 TRINITY_DN6491_c0_g1~~TRINITY_DN6491_c0_g1_i2.p1  ORF type:complete len:953 (-),score=324.01 TRINITY_DN6491_c0_g1_i2:1894-4752(-)